MANSTTKLTISLSGYKNRYPPSVNCNPEIQIPEEDWPTHCVFFEKETDFDISPFLPRVTSVDSEDISSENRELWTYHEFRKLFTDSPEHPAALQHDDVMIDINLDSPCYGCLGASSTPGQTVQEFNKKREIIGQRLAGKRIRHLQHGEEFGDWGHQINSGIMALEENDLIPLPQQAMSITTTRSQSSFFSTVRKQLSNLFNRPERKTFDSEFYV